MGSLLIDTCSKNHLHKNREELKKGAAKEKYKNLSVQGWSTTEEDWTKKES